ncbi:MAG: glycoside hydrolase family 3 N-terminal domain-containing protein [Candidatus Nealsonbacteria bacterium]
MNQDNNQKKAENLTDHKEEKDFLAREEIKTMEKDISRLRETEARQEREKVAGIKTAEEITKQKEREKLAQQAALERSSAEKEAKEREERIKRMRQEREVKENAMTETGAGKETANSSQFQDALKETQTREDEARKKFMARVEAKAEGKEIASAPSPLPQVMLPPLPQVPPVIQKEKISEITKTFLKRPSFSQKLWIRVVLALLVLSLLALIATFWYWYFVVRPAQPPADEQETTAPKELIIPTPLFYTERSQTLKISQSDNVLLLLARALENEMVSGSIDRILIENTESAEILGLKEFFDSLAITPPEGFYNKLSNDATLFIYSQEEGNRLGLVVKINDQEGLADIMTSWEGTMEENFQNLFELFNKNEPALISYFKDAEYQEAGFRFQTFNRKDVGLVYAIFDDYFILTTSWKSMEKALDKLKEVPLSRFSSPPANNEGAIFILESMALKEKIGQLFFIGINGTTLSEETEKLIASIQPGGILLLKKNIVNKDQTRKLIRDIQQVALKNYGIPLFIGVDQEGGEISPVNFIQEKTAQSAIKTTEQAYAVGLSRGKELRDLGINLNLAPVLDTAQPGDFVFGRAFQATDLETNAFAKALISGQKTASILTAIKHFPGYGDITFDPEDKLATLAETPQISLFETAAQAKPEFIMTSNVIYSEIDPDLPFSFSPEGIKLLKQSVGQEPLIMTDDLPQQSLIDKFSLKGVITLPIRAGADILTFSTNWETTLLPEAVRILNEAVQNGEISREEIDDSVLKIIKLKKAYYQYE